MIKKMTNFHDEIEEMKIINNTTKEEIAFITFSDGMINIKTKEPYSIYTKKKKKGKNKMKLSEFKEYIINKFGEKSWENYENTYAYSIYSSNEEEQKKVLQKDGTNIRYINNPSEEVQFEAIKENGYAIQFINNPSEEIQFEAIKQNPLSIIDIKNPSEKLIEEAVKGINYSFDSGYLLRHIENDLKGE